MTIIIAVVAALVGVVAAIFALFMVGMRRKWRLVLDAVRRVNRAVFNPRQMRSAGTPGAYASIIHHTGRTSGTAYETPVGAVSTDDGFVITLPYGTRADWVRNVLAAGRARIDHEGGSHDVDRPVVIGRTDVESYFSPKEQREQRLFGVDDFLQVRTV